VSVCIPCWATSKGLGPRSSSRAVLGACMLPMQAGSPAEPDRSCACAAAAGVTGPHARASSQLCANTPAHQQDQLHSTGTAASAVACTAHTFCVTSGPAQRPKPPKHGGYCISPSQPPPTCFSPEHDAPHPTSSLTLTTLPLSIPPQSLHTTQACAAPGCGHVQWASRLLQRCRD
jgi:hypothetical protein